MPEYQVTSQIRVVDRDPSDLQIKRGWRVTYRDLGVGVTGEVFAPDESYTPETVRALILNQLQTIRAVHTDGG